jgi:hypothetical protein
MALPSSVLPLFDVPTLCAQVNNKTGEKTLKMAQ